MSWLRIDDRFASHPKIAQLSDKEFRVWMRLLCFCATYNDPSVDAVARREVPGLTERTVARFSQVGLLDESGKSLEIHDWSVFQPADKTGADRQAKWRARNAGRNGRVTDGSVTEALPSRARRARSPVPSPTRPKEQDPKPIVREEVSLVTAKWSAHAPPLIVHRDSYLTSPKARAAVEGALRVYPVEAVVEAVVSYATVLGGMEYRWDYRWTLIDFLKRGLDRFVPEGAPLENFKVRADTNGRLSNAEHNAAVLARSRERWAKEGAA